MSQTLKIAIPMAGYGSRMRPQTWNKPKVLLPLAGGTVLDHFLRQFDTLPANLEKEYVFIVSPFQLEQVQAYIQEHYPHLRAQWVVQEVMRGQSDALWNARQHLTGPMLMTFSDTLVETDLSGLNTETLDGVAWVKPVPDPRSFGVAEVNAAGRVTRLVEKPQDLSNNLVVVGFYYFRSAEALLHAIQEQFRRNLSLNNEFFLAEAVNVMLEQGLQFRVQEVGTWLDAGKPVTILETNAWLLTHGRENSIEAARRPGVAVIPPVYIHPTAQVESSVVGPHVSIGAGCSLKNVVIQNSILDANTRLENLVLADSLLGRGVTMTGAVQHVNLGDTSAVKA
ncbi:MAG TPA: sugar phosphate nucleotidyltransferase [Anaerolineaceae bacterium]|nr:sugar phosphate nucleotidyltransferase [Anaerolineaceae bacterium]